ncbi:MAG: hypothetical protein L3K09_06255, partial [Thermoplasmata archaeon]|nr:hypothetical protein [Thermoplasmata archaeon]
MLSAVLLLGGASSDVALRYNLAGRVTGTAPMAPLSAVTTNAGAGGCASAATGSVPFGAGSPRAAATVVEPG